MRCRALSTHRRKRPQTLRRPVPLRGAPSLHLRAEAAASVLTMNNGDIARYSKRIVQYFWDPLPSNDDASPIWCLARQYESKPRIAEDAVAPHGESPPQLSASQASTSSSVAGASRSHTSSDDDAPIMVEDPTASEADRGWPPAFLDDFESRIWMTYRSNFTPIHKSQDPKAMAAMSFSVRLKSQLTNQGGFSSDSGWGCMIRSGQGLLANALSILHLGRGKYTCRWRGNC